MADLIVQRNASPLPPGTAACLGAFDGMHLGHQALVGRARAAQSHVAVVTFEPHPLRVLSPERAPRLLQTPVQRARIAAHLGVEVLVLLPFDRPMAELSPEAFVQMYLVEGLRPASVVVGPDFRFGARRAGDVERLRVLLGPAGIDVEVVEPFPALGAVPGEGPHKLGSTDVRRAIDAGDVERAGAMLGRWHTVAGRVVPGHRRGRDIGFPTANIDYGDGYLPPTGIYATALVVWDERSPDFGAVWPAATSIGHNPTFGPDAPLSLEAHVIDQDLGDRLYGMEVEVAFVHRLRDELRFDSVPDLVARIRQDVEEARSYLGVENLAGVVAPVPR